MLFRMLALLVMLFSKNIQAFEFPIEIIEYIDNTRIVAFINEADIDQSLDWVPFNSSPPLSITDALNAIKIHNLANPNLANARLTGIELKRIPHHEKSWHYLVKMKSRVNNRSHAYYFIVLMNGKIIPGLRESQSLK